MIGNIGGYENQIQTIFEKLEKRKENIEN